MTSNLGVDSTVVINTPPPEGGRRSRLADERQEREAPHQDAEILDSRTLRAADSNSQAPSLAPQPDASPFQSQPFTPQAFETQRREQESSATQTFAPQNFAPHPFGFPAEPVDESDGTRVMAAMPIAHRQAPSPWGGPASSAQSFGAPGAGPITTELEDHGRRAARRPQTSRRGAGVIFGLSLTDRRVWGGVLAVAVAAVTAVLVVPGLLQKDSVAVADGGLSGTSANLTIPKESAKSPRLGQPDVAGSAEIVEASAADALARAEAKAKASAADAAAIAAKMAITDGEKKSPDEAKDEAQPETKAQAPQQPTSGSTGRLNNSQSGLAWVSGIYPARKGIAGVKEWGDWRGAPADVIIDWGQRQTWEDVVNPTYMLNSWGGTAFTKVFTLPPIPEGDGATMAECAAGAYNDKWRQFGENAKAAGVDDESVIRLGWELNGNWYKWSAIDNPGQFAECWRQVVASAESVAPALLWDWNVNRGVGNTTMGDPTQAYPGDSYVDIIGVDSYDWFPAVKSEADWNTQYAGAFGLKFWSDFARDHGKRISVPEWGVYPGSEAGGGDNPFYISKMQGFFKEQGAHLAYEAYFNEFEAYYSGSLLSPVQNPNASERYRSLFGR